MPWWLAGKAAPRAWKRVLAQRDRTRMKNIVGKAIRA
jgi:hypothetical protein